MGYKINPVLNVVPISYHDGNLYIGLSGYESVIPIPALQKHEFPYQCNQLVSEHVCAFLFNDTFSCYLRHNGTGMLVALSSKTVVKNFQWDYRVFPMQEAVYGGSFNEGRLLLYRSNYNGLEVMSNQHIPATLMFKMENNPEYSYVVKASKNIAEPHIVLEKSPTGVIANIVHNYGKVLFTLKECSIFQSDGFKVLE